MNNIMSEDNLPPNYIPGMGPHGPTGSPGFGAPMDGGGLDPDIMENGGLVGKAGEPFEEGTPIRSREAIIEALKTVYDPEIPVDIYELGLIYDIDISEIGSIKIQMTLTAPGCPVAGILPQQVADAASSAEGTGLIGVYLVWEPAWDMEKMSEDAKLALGMY